MNIAQLLTAFIQQAHTTDLRTASYPKEIFGYKTKVSFGMGAPARIPWIALTAPDISVSNGFFPAYLYYKSLNTLILSYGISETNEFEHPWSPEIESTHLTIEGYLGQKVPRYGNSYVFKAYSVNDNGLREIYDNKIGKQVTELELEQNLRQILSDYQKVTNFQSSNPNSTIGKGAFYLEKQLEDFIISNWESTELGSKMDLILQDGELVSQQYKTEIGPIDILAKDKDTGSHVVIELKKVQTSEDTIGQITRYMGWVEDQLKDAGVRGVIIASSFDKKLEYALKRVSGVEVYIYEIDFKLKEFKGNL